MKGTTFSSSYFRDHNRTSHTPTLPTNQKTALFGGMNNVTTNKLKYRILQLPVNINKYRIHFPAT